MIAIDKILVEDASISWTLSRETIKHSDHGFFHDVRCSVLETVTLAQMQMKCGALEGQEFWAIGKGIELPLPSRIGGLSFKI